MVFPPCSPLQKFPSEGLQRGGHLQLFFRGLLPAARIQKFLCRTSSPVVSSSAFIAGVPSRVYPIILPSKLSHTVPLKGRSLNCVSLGLSPPWVPLQVFTYWVFPPGGPPIIHSRGFGQMGRLIRSLQGVAHSLILGCPLQGIHSMWSPTTCPLHVVPPTGSLHSPLYKAPPGGPI
jgi:hypothetical protein